MADWKKSVCMLWSVNCGGEIRLGDDGQTFERVRGNKDHVSSKGYTCEKALRLGHYQNANGRLTSPMRRRDDGTYEAVDWDTAIAEVSAGLKAVGGDGILYYGGGGQGNHLGGGYGAATRRAYGITRRSNALAQEKTGEAWVDGRMFGTHTHGDFHHAELSIFVGKNPWHSHGFPETRRVLKEIAADDSRTMIVIDPRRSETADLADQHLQVVPGTDAFAIAAILGRMVELGHVDERWLREHTEGHDEVLAVLRDVPVADFTERAGLSPAEIDEAANRIGAAKGVAVLEDLGIEMAPNSTLVSYLQKLLFVLRGSFNVEGGVTTHSALAGLFNYSTTGREPEAPVTGSAVISGLLPCNEIPETVLTDHPDRIRGMVIESGNPVHSLADSHAWRAAMAELEFSVVIDCFMTETAREASYVLPASSQFEKAETTFFNLSFPDNTITVRAPIVEPLEGTLPEAEIHSRLVRAAGLLDDDLIASLRAAAEESREAFGAAFIEAAGTHPEIGQVGAVVLYETLGKTLPKGMEPAAALWFMAHQFAMKDPAAVAAAGHQGEGLELGEALFDAMVNERDGVVFSRHDIDQTWNMVETPDRKVRMAIPELLEDLAGLADRPATHATDEFPFILAAGERRSFTANTIMRDPAWRKRDQQGALRLSPGDADRIGVEDGQRVRITTRAGTAVAVAEINDTYRDGHVALPNGFGLDYSPAGGDPEPTGVSPNELTSADWKDEIAGTPWHKHVPARLEPVSPLATA